LESDIRTVSEKWFDHESHDSVKEFVCALSLAYFRFSVPDRYTGPTRYRMDTLFRMFVLKELHSREHETSLVDYLKNGPEHCEQLGFATIPDQSTLWRSWHDRFTPDHRQPVETAARTILIKAQNAGIGIPREPTRTLHGNKSGESDPDDQTTLEQAEKIGDHVSRIVFPAFSLDRGDGCEIHENAYLGLQTYLGVRERLDANEDARCFIYESTRERTPLGNAHREQIRDLSIEQIPEMYRQAGNGLLSEVAETEEFFRAVIIAIDITEADPSPVMERDTKTKSSGGRRRATSTPNSGPPSS